MILTLSIICTSLAVTVAFLMRMLYVSRQANQALLELVDALMSEEVEDWMMAAVEDFDEVTESMP